MIKPKKKKKTTKGGLERGIFYRQSEVNYQELNI